MDDTPKHGMELCYYLSCNNTSGSIGMSAAIEDNEKNYQKSE